MNKMNDKIYFAIIFTVVSIVITIASWLVISLSNTQNHWFYFFPFFGAIISLVFSTIVLFQKKIALPSLCERKSDNLNITKCTVKITFDIDDTPVLLEAPDVESVAKLLEILRPKNSESMVKDIYDFPEFP